MGRYEKKISRQSTNSVEPRLCVGCKASCFITSCKGSCNHTCKGTGSSRPAIRTIMVS